MSAVTVVPADRLIIVDGEALLLEFSAPEGLHALQWKGESGHTEWTDGPNRLLTAADYGEQVAPFVTAWQAEKARREEDAAREAAARALPDARAAKTAEIQSGYDAALAASLTMPVDSPTAQDVSIGAALFAVDDAEGLAFVRETHAARRDELLAAVAAAESVEAVQAVEVSYAV
ncbi:phage tail protein [uncultured Desulfovibrio sp.]|uniref:phage tail protein n=1 Tax=uncultured Desulfovibrio sp. TaxID=167968 RepID=UPI002631A9F2|nr:phage tail protein [uncultured Desulfovibrio sp.]